MSTQKVEYVVGFLFDARFERVVAIRKLKPAWQKGYFNGVGGKIEQDETPLQAMQREWTEETGDFTLHAWRQFAHLSGEGFSLWCFAASGNIHYAHTTTAEDVVVLQVEDVRLRGSARTLPNLRWLVPMAIEALQPGGPFYDMVQT